MRSQYAVGDRCQDLSDPLSQLCVPSSGVDCELAIDPHRWYRFVTKFDLDAWQEPAFRGEVDALPEHIRTVVVCGVTATSCVRLAARGLALGWAAPRAGRRVVVVPTARCGQTGGVRGDRRSILAVPDGASGHARRGRTARAGLTQER